MSKVSKPICYGDIVYIQCDKLVLMANGQSIPTLHLNSTENIAIKSFRNGLFMLYPNLSYKDITQVEQLEHQLELLKSLNPEETYAAQQLEEDIRKEKLILEEREAKLVALNDKMFEESKGQPIKYHQKVQLLHVESRMFVGLSSVFDKEDKNMNYLELTKEGSKNLYFEFAPKLDIQEREIVDYDTPVSFISSKSQTGLKLGVEIDKTKIKIELNPASNQLCGENDDFPAIPPRRKEPIYETEKLYAVGMSEIIGTESIRVKKFTSHQDQVKAESKKYLKNGDYIRITNSKFYLHVFTSKSAMPAFFQAFGVNTDYKFSNVYTLFQILEVTACKIINEEGVKEPFNANTLPEGHLLEYHENNRYILKHFATGKILTYKDASLVPLLIDDAAKLETISFTIGGRSETDQTNNYIDKNAVLQIKCYDNTEKYQGTFQLSEAIKIPNVQLETNTYFYYGFLRPENYLNKTLRTERFQQKISQDVDILSSSFKFLRATDEDLSSIQFAEGFTNEVQRFLDFLHEFKTGKPENLKEFNRKVLKLANFCKQYAQEMYEGDYNEALEDILIPNNLHQHLLREFVAFSLLFMTLKCLIFDEEFKKKVDELMRKTTDEGIAQVIAETKVAEVVKDDAATQADGEKIVDTEKKEEEKPTEAEKKEEEKATEAEKKEDEKATEAEKKRRFPSESGR